MLNPKLITDAIVAKLKLIPALATAMTASAVVRISAFHYRLGAESSLVEAVYKMPVPSILVAWEGTKGGNFNGYQIFKHTFGVYIRMDNAAGVGSPVGYEDLWALICNGIPSDGTQNMRYITVLSGLDIMDTPSVDHRLDEDQIDFFKGVFSFPEIGDQ